MYKVYHIPGKKIGVTKDLKRRVEDQQGYDPSEYQIILETDNINIASDMERLMQAEYGYPIDQTPYKNLNCNKPTMRINVTEQTTTFPVPLNKLKGRLLDNMDMMIGDQQMSTRLAMWIVGNAVTSQFNEDRCYVYNKAMQNFINSWDNDTLDKASTNTSTSDMFDKIRKWAALKGIIVSGNPETQYMKLMEEAGELAEGLLKKDDAEIRDAIGDMVVVLTNLAALKGWNIEDCIQGAYDEIKNRVGVMENGTFVKFNETLS